MIAEMIFSLFGIRPGPSAPNPEILFPIAGKRIEKGLDPI